MYVVDNRDRVVELSDVPQSSPGAPLPIVLSDEQRTLLAYLVHEPQPDWDGTTVRVVDYDTVGERVALVEFQRRYSLMFGSPNDEAFDGHPLASRGLRPYRAFVIENSSWVRQLERMNSVHEYHDPKGYERLKHVVFAFHDSTFECVAEGFEVSEHDGSLQEILSLMQGRLTTF